MTEEEAKVVQCCGPEGTGYFNDDPRPARWCVGTACMAWRWKDAPVATRRLNPDKPAPFDKVGDGFCGLAGRP